ncbi:unnamed protein product [Cunninghamella blakesleeana]
MTVNQPSPFISIDKHTQNTVNPFIKNDMHMTDDIYMNNSTNICTKKGSKHCERIENVDTYLSEGTKEDNSGDTKESGIYSLFYQQKPIVPTMINGTLLPMEKKQGEDKLCIPDFVLRITPSSNMDKMNSLMYIDSNNNSNSINNVFVYGNNDPISMDID